VDAAAAVAPAAPAALPFIEDDYAHALADARAAHRPLFVDAWAPWCHTCLSMRAFTFRDAKVRAHAADFTWASIDTEKPANAAWVAAHPMHAWPTLFVVDADGDRTVLEWAQSATADELVALLAGAKSSMKSAPLPAGAATLEGELDRFMTQKDFAGCATTADRELSSIPRGGGRATTTALRCATEIPEGAREPLLHHLIDRARTIVVDDNEPILADDRSDLYESIVDALGTEKRDAEAKQVATAWAAYLEGEAQRAVDATARSVFDAHRLEAYLAIGAPDRAVAMLRQSARDFPGDYNPPARLARAYLAMKQDDDAVAAIDRALALVYGPRALRLYATKADILEAKGDRLGAAAALNDGVAKARAAALPPRYAKAVDDLAKRAHALEVSAH
jgi:tetratricopeptide (TPR) repeat protein